ncbi:hypothetical protein HMPREF2942_00375 [Rothia sp. HMSC071C12]|uniref:RES family NAD+ phosphorylase n=1 Tax=Rothia sp. HMSC071C12 TaxID=1739446 RepID=UPI0008A4691D|nr:RES family NAD+ phosphorylase [Rothia sp. HMSC071C12]OFQ33393.1 hypothetical protein HMPREF2942_00375 [Rothia sp. HMSC071C12]
MAIECHHTPQNIIPPDADACLNQYPLVLVGPGTDIPVVYRVHDTYDPDGSPRSPLFYSSAWEPGTAPYMGGRFGLQGSKGLGTCNTGMSPLAAIREELGTDLSRTEIPRSRLAGKSISRIRLKHPIVLVDARVNGPGYCADCVSDARHNGTKYALTQPWAQGIYELGAGGIISNSSLEETENVYLYGPAGVYEGDLEVEETVELIEVYREYLAQGAGLPIIAEDIKNVPVLSDDFGDALHDSLFPN